LIQEVVSCLGLPKVNECLSCPCARADRSGALTLARCSLMPSLSRAGVLLLQCSDSVAWGKWGSTEQSLTSRFHADFGTRFTVECPTRCSLALPLLYGCGKGPYMDESSICKAAGNHKNSHGHVHRVFMPLSCHILLCWPPIVAALCMLCCYVTDPLRGSVSI
jgi:hypothetical protein